MKRKAVSAFAFTVWLLLLMLSCRQTASGWSNGGYSDDPLHPDYGTHDWIAQHALDWLPLEEKQYILNDLAAYLYGTELPDNGEAIDGIGDTVNHHVYYFTNGSLQEDDSAVRASEEYAEALDFATAGNLTDAVKSLGIMTHYIADLASFGHVMGSHSVWGEATRHSDYENYVRTRTNTYDDEFNTYLEWDNTLANVSAYNASTTLAYDTTFDAGGVYNCTWMEKNYDWNNPAFKDRCGESLNLAVNAIADVLHSFYLEAAPYVPEYQPVIAISLLLAILLTISCAAILKRPKLQRNYR